MTKRSLFLTLAAGFLASVAFATPSRAGSELYDITASFHIVPTNVTVTDMEISITAFPESSFKTVDNGGLSGLTYGTNTNSQFGDQIVVNFSPTETTTGNLVFQFTGPTGLALDGPFYVTGNSAPFTASGIAVALTVVPEPSSMALLGIGVTGLLAFRRMFKRPTSA